jgi:uncharacterized protein (DUF697 family)
MAHISLADRVVLQPVQHAMITAGALVFCFYYVAGAAVGIAAGLAHVLAGGTRHLHLVSVQRHLP